MAYTVQNFKTKKELKEAVASYNAVQIVSGRENVNAPAVRAYQPGLGLDLSNYTGKVCIEGPHYPAAHTWYAECEMKDGVIIKVK